MSLLLIFSLAVINLIILLVVLINAIKWPGLKTLSTTADASVSILIPARNEATHMEEALRSAIIQGPTVKEILVYDDHSDDGTGEIVELMRQESPLIQLVQPIPLAEGWFGKPFACAQLGRSASGQWLLFLDADTRLHAGAVSLMLGEAKQRGITFLSCWPALLAGSFWEHVFMPMLNFVVFSLFPTPMQERDSRPSFGLAHGACLFIHRAEYESIGGHACVKQEIFEDTVLARVWRENNLKGLCLDGQKMVSVRMYTNLREMIQGFSKIAYPAFRKECSFWLFIGFHSLFMLMPMVLLFFAKPLGLSILGLSIATGAVVSARAVQCFQFGYPIWSVLFHPVAEIGLIGLGLYARHQCRHRSGVQWKGRTYNPTEQR